MNARNVMMCKSAIYPDGCYITAVSKETVQSRRLSTGEGWIVRSSSEQTRERALGRYSSTDSLSSYSSGASRHPVPVKVGVHSAKSTPSLNQQDGRLEGQLPGFVPNGPLVASLSSSQSTPNLDKEVEPADAMVSRKFKKASVYEALANKSGLDFAPTIQSRHNHWEAKERRDGSFGALHQRSSSTSSCQSYHCRQTSNQSTASDCTSSSSSCNGQPFHSRQMSGHSSYSEDEGRVLSPRNDESPAPELPPPPPFPVHDSLPAFPSNRFRPDRGRIADDLRAASHWTRSQPELDRLPPSPASPPPPAPPVRDASSLKYVGYGADHHEKYPSWPVGQSDGSSGGGGGKQRSHSWTEDPAESSKDKGAPNYSRGKKYSQTSFTQQLKTVMEKTEKVALDDPRLLVVFQGQYFSHLEDHSATSRLARYELDALCRLDSTCAQPYDRDFSFGDFDVHSPPERDVTPEKQQRRVAADRGCSNGGGGGDYWWPSPSSSVSGAQYSSEAALVLQSAAAVGSHQATPMLDRLRLESSRWSGESDTDGRGGSTGGGAGGRDSITSTTSSQETLKWHGSSSDLSVHSDKQPKPSVESVVHSARVQPPQRHNSESVLYYGVDEAAALARSVVGNGRDGGGASPQKRGSLPSLANSDTTAPPLPRKNRQWSDQVQKNNYINRIQMQVRPVAPSGEHVAVATNGAPGGGFRAAGLAREEIQPPLSPEFAKPLSVAERIQDLERQARNGNHRGAPVNHCHRSYAAATTAVAKMQRKQQKVPPGASPSSTTSGPVQRQTWAEAPQATPEKRMAYLDPEKKHKVSDPELKAIQKQAVWSFFERQTGLSPHGRSPTKEGVQFLSRRMAQSLPRDYMQEFKRLQQLQQQSEDKKLGGTGGPVTATSVPFQAKPENGLVDRKEVAVEAVPACPPRLYRQLNGPTLATSPSKRAVKQQHQLHHPSTRGSTSSSSSSASSPTTPTAPSSVASSTPPRTPSICYNTCTQTDDSDILTLEAEPVRNGGMCVATSSTTLPAAAHQNARSHPDHSSHTKAVPLEACPSDKVETMIPSISGELKSLLRNEEQDQSKERPELELDLPKISVPPPPPPPLPSSSPPSLQELRILEEPVLEPNSDNSNVSSSSSSSSSGSSSSNVPCEQTPTKVVHKTATVDSIEVSLDVTGMSEGSERTWDQSNDERRDSVMDLPEERRSQPSPVTDSIEDIELRKIEESAKVLRNLLPSGSSGTYTPRTHRRLFLNSEGVRSSPSPSVSCPSSSSRCSSPDLPLPPPPKNSEMEVFTNDEPLPPPPSLNEMMNHALAEPQAATKTSSPSLALDDTYLSYCEEPQQQLNKSAYDDSHHCHRNLIASSKMDKSLSPCSAWEQWHNIRQSNTTLVFHSGEMKVSKTPHIKMNSTGPASGRTSGKEEEWNCSLESGSLGVVDEHGAVSNCRLSVPARHSPTARLKATGSVESLRSVGSNNSTASSLSCWQENEATSSSSSPSSRSSSAAGSSLHSKNSDIHSHCHSPVSYNPLSSQSPAPPSTKDDVVQRVTEAVTQTTPSLSKLGRKKREEELECERLSRDLVNHLSGQDHALRNILVLAPEMKTMADYMEGIFEVDVKASSGVNRRSDSTCSSGRGTGSSSSSSPPPVVEQTKRMSSDAVHLPSDSAYFTTSESKARFLTRYSKNMQQSQAAALDDLRNGSELSKKKEELVDSITRKLKILRMEQLAIREEIRINDELGSAVSNRVEQLAKSNEVDKFKLHVEEVEKITSLLLGLSGRLARAQNALMTLAETANPEEKKSLEAKRNKLSEQHEEAKKLKESIDRRGNQVSSFLHKYLSSEEYADYDHFIKMKAKLLMDSREIDDKIKLGEEQMSALQENLKT